MATDLGRLETALNARTARGEMLDALGEFYDKDCVFEEGDGSRRVGRDAQHEHLSRFFGSLRGLNRAALHGQAVGEGITASEWTFDMTGGDDQPIVWNEVLVRRWRNGLVVSERFYPAQS